MREERGVLRGDPAAVVIWDVHVIGGSIPVVGFGRVERQLGLKAGEVLGLLDSETSHHGGGVVEVEARHQVRVGVVVDHRRVLVGTGDAVDVEAPVVAEEAEIHPHPCGLDEDLGAGLDEKVGVTANVDVAADGVGDVGVEVELGGAGEVIGRRLVAADRAPREQGTPQIQLAGATPRLVQHAVAEPKQVAGDARLGVGEERQHPRLGVPEVVAVVGVAGQALGRDSRSFGAPRRLGEVEQVPAHRLLHADRVPFSVLERHVCPLPESIEVAPLSRHERLEPGADHTVEGAPATLHELGCVDAA